MPVLSLQSCKAKGLNWPFFVFLGAISDCNAGFPQWRALAETLRDFKFMVIDPANSWITSHLVIWQKYL